MKSTFGYAPSQGAMQSDTDLSISPRFRKKEMREKREKRFNVVSPIPLEKEDPLFEHDVELIESINSDKSSSWQAQSHNEFVGKRMSEMMRLLGKRTYKKGHLKVRAIADTRADAEKYGNLPSDFSWLNYKGINYDSPVRNQGECGSCYAVAVVYVMEARLRIKTKLADQTLLSPQEVVSCSRYNQGCDGGYPILVGKHGEEFGFVPDSCFPYEAFNSDCSKSCQASKRYKVNNHHYIGGYYGACNEVDMMKEIHKGGPIVVAFEAPQQLFYYNKGVFTGPSPKSEPNEEGIHKWEQTNHAVVAVGWGVADDGMKYWIIKNTWGPNWGQKGYFKIRRGTDECAIESMASAFDVVV